MQGQALEQKEFEDWVAAVEKGAARAEGGESNPLTREGSVRMGGGDRPAPPPEPGTPPRTLTPKTSMLAMKRFAKASASDEKKSAEMAAWETIMSMPGEAAPSSGRSSPRGGARPSMRGGGGAGRPSMRPGGRGGRKPMSAAGMKARAAARRKRG